MCAPLKKHWHAVRITAVNKEYRMKTTMEKLGLSPVRRLNKKICLTRVNYLRKKIEQKKYRSNLLPYAKYYANWYGWLAVNGGTRSRPRSRAA